MTHKIHLEATQVGEFRTAYGKKIVATVVGSSLNKRKAYLPLDPNIRRPTKNFVVQGILENIKSFSGSYTIGGQISVVCRSVKILTGREGQAPYVIEIEMAQGDGVIDGGHRCEAMYKANMNPDIFLTENVFLTFSIEEGLPEQVRKERAVIENTSKSPRGSSIAFHRGDYDWLVEIIKDDGRFPNIAFTEGHVGVSDCPQCRLSHLAILPLFVDTDRYDPMQIGSGIIKLKHPARFSSRTNSLGGLTQNKVFEIMKRNIKLQNVALDLIEIYCDIHKEIDSRHRLSTGSLPGVKESSHVKRNTSLPDGTVLSCIISNRVYAPILISMFRVALDDWKWKIPLSEFKDSFVKQLITSLIKEFGKASRGFSITDTIHKDEKLWDDMYKHALDTYASLEKRYIDKRSKAVGLQQEIASLSGAAK